MRRNRRPVHTPAALGRRTLTLAALLGLALTLHTAGPVHAAGKTPEPRSFDARTTRPEAESAVEPGPAQLAAIENLRALYPDLGVTFDRATGATRTLSNRVGYLTAARPGEDALAVALDWAGDNLDLLGLTPADLEGFEITDRVPTRVTGAEHIYLRQTHAGLSVYNAQLHVNVNRDGRILSVNNAFLPELSAAVKGIEPILDAGDALLRAAEHVGQQVPRAPVVLDGPRGAARLTRLDAQGFSREPIEARLMWLPVRRGDARLVWNLQVATLDGLHWYDMNVDARDGAIWTRFDWVDDAEYRVYPPPNESPNHATPLPPADGRQLIVDPHLDAPNASPNGWHDTGMATFTTMQGNNVHAWEDPDGNEVPPAVEISCGAGLSCDFPLDLTMAPSTYSGAAVANLFYWNNLIHDVQYQYGFDEVSGNFQENNFGNGGLGGDSVNAQAQSGFFLCPNNAFFSTPADGSNGTMRMCLWTTASPQKDGDFDNGIIAHEFGHGISNRQVGGPNNVSCLDNSQQPGEGWSDWFSLVYTHEPGDLGTDTRGIGTFALDQPTSGPGIRTQPYSTDPAVNTWTYASIAGMAVPHGVGSVWAQGIWEVYWALVDEHGFDPDLYDVGAGAGNHRAILYVNEGFKNTACGPSFLDTRDGVIQAAVDNFGGEDVCLVWEAFAAYGLGTDASTPGPSSTTATNGFEIPLECQCTVPALPSGLAAANNGDNRIDLSWSASATPNVTYNVYRSFDGCPQTDPVLIASGLATTSFSDLDVSGGTTYSYTVSAVDETGNCETAVTACAEETATGTCTRAPTFAGIATATNAGSPACAVQLDWDAGSIHCGANAVYNVYRSTTSGVVGPLLASCLTNTDYTDLTVNNGVEYFYVVRSEDDSGNGSGACAGGNEDANSLEAAVTPTGPISIDLDDDIEGGAGNWTTTAGPADTGTTPWAIVSTDSHSPTQSWFTADEAVVKDQRVELVGQILSPGTLEFWHRFDTESGFDGGVLEYSTDGGTTWIDILAGDGGGVPANPARFLLNGYNDTLSTGFSNPLPGRDAWSGSSGGFQQVMVDMSDFIGESVLLRWRLGCDSSVSGTGWWVDDVLVSAVGTCNSGLPIFSDGFETGDTSLWTLDNP